MRLLKSFVFLLLLWPAVAYSQSDMPQQQKQCYAEKTRALLGPFANPSFFYQHRINLNAYQKLKKHGLDLKALPIRVFGYNYLEQVLFADLVVKGKVVGMEEAERNNGGFRTVYRLQLEDTYAGKKLPKMLTLHSRSAAGGGGWFSFNNEPVLRIGEEVILYLQEQELATGKQHQPGPKQYKMEQIRLRPTQQEGQIVYVPTLKLFVKDGALLEENGRQLGSVKLFGKTVKKISRANDPEGFFKRNYCK